METDQNEKATPEKKQRVDESALVNHSYQDFATVPFQQAVVTGIRSSSNFPAKLHAIVSTPEYQHIIGWLPHGRSWEVKDKALLVSVVLHEHFNHNNFESFNRQVNLWGFKRLHRPGPDYKSYYHEAFLRSRPDLIPLIRRLKKGEQKPIDTTEPNFYQMPFLPQLQCPRPRFQPQIPGNFSNSSLNSNTVAAAAQESCVDQLNSAYIESQFDTSSRLQNFQAATDHINSFQALSANNFNITDNQQANHSASHNPTHQLILGASIGTPNVLLNTSSLGAGNDSNTQQQNISCFAHSTGGECSSNLDKKVAAQPDSLSPGLERDTRNSNANSIRHTPGTSVAFQAPLPNETSNINSFQGLTANNCNTAASQAPILNNANNNHAYYAAFHNLTHQLPDASIGSPSISINNLSAGEGAGYVSHNSQRESELTGGECLSDLDHKPEVNPDSLSSGFNREASSSIVNPIQHTHWTVATPLAIFDGYNHTERDDRSNTATTNTAQSRAASANRNTPLGAGLSLEGIAMLSNPPNDPILREFAEQYLPYFEQSNDSGSNSE